MSTSQVKAVDRICEERFGIPTDWLMEAAGWQVARVCTERTAVVCGVGNNAGDGLAAARHLHRWGRLAAVSCVDAGRLRGPAARQLDALRAGGVEIADDLRLEAGTWILDAIFGTGLSRPPEGRFKDWIEEINAGHGHYVMALDVPSGLDAESGVAYAPTVHAHATVTLGLPKRGLAELECAGVVVDIGVPLEAYRAVGANVPADLFTKADWVPL